MTAAPIVVACPALALDVTLDLPERLSPGVEQRASAVDARAGGKGVNVARALRAIGTDASVVGLVGGPIGAAVSALAAAEGLRLRPVKTDAPTRVCAAMAAPDEVTPVYPFAAPVEPAAWTRFEAAVTEELERPDGILVISGSLPPGVEPDAVARLVRLAQDRGWRTICDTAGDPLRHALAANPDVVAPNRAEAAAVTGAERPAAALVALGARAALVSAGGDGAELATTADTTTTLPAHPVRVRNPVGAGDCCTAGLAAGLAANQSLLDAARLGMALAAASCETVAAADLDAGRARELLAAAR